jgi:DNA-binding NtrC family response regulator
MTREILIIDDKIRVCESLARNFNHWGYTSHSAVNGKDAVTIYSANPIRAVILDVVLENENGLDILKELLTIKEAPVIMITGYASIETAVQSIKIGAYDYLTKPVDFNKLLKVVENAVRACELQDENKNLKRILSDFSSKTITNNTVMKELYTKAKRLAVTDIPILICGENGTGKELLADFIHTHSPRVSHRIVKINCANFPEHLLENELFGHEPGAYTGADTVFKGVFEQAHEGTLFLDEIGDMSLSLQARILRVLQNNEIRRLGGTETIHIDTRFIAATNKNIEEMLGNNKFRTDLYYRVSAATLRVPPLRERKEDIPNLVNVFLVEYTDMNEKQVNRLSDTVLSLFMKYDWPGNIRELKNTIHYGCAITMNDCIDAEDLPANFACQGIENLHHNIRASNEKNLIIQVLQRTHNNKKRAAEILCMSRKTLYNKIEKYGIRNAST